MDSFFSGTDDKYELGDPGLHIVVGNIDLAQRSYTVKASVTANFRRFMVDDVNVIDPDDHDIDTTYHPDVLNAIELPKQAPRTQQSLPTIEYRPVAATRDFTSLTAEMEAVRQAANDLILAATTKAVPYDDALSELAMELDGLAFYSVRPMSTFNEDPFYWNDNNVFNPTEAPPVHIELLPSNAVAVKAEAKDYVTSKSTNPAVFIAVWAPRTTPMSCVDGQDNDDFMETHCYDCQYYTEEMEFDAGTLGYPEIDTPEGHLEVTGTVYFLSPCSCYSEGLGDIEFPCHAGHDGPSDNEPSFEKLGCEYMQYGVVRSLQGTLLTDWAQQQGIHFEAGYAAVTDSTLPLILLMDNGISAGVAMIQAIIC